MKRIVLVVLSVLVLGGLGVGIVYLSRAGTADGSTAAADGDAAGQDDAAADATDADGQPSDEKPGDGKTAIPVDVVTVARGDVSTYISATANLVPEDDVTVLAEAEGRVDRLLVEEGDRVASGQLLAALQRDEAQILYDKAKIKATNAEMAHERSVRMAREKLLAQEEFDRTALEADVARQELAEAEWRLTRTEIRAPFDGRVTRRDITQGQHVRVGDSLFQVTSFEPLVARIYLPEADVLSLDTGRDVRITLKADESVQFAGRIQRISPVVDTATGTVKVTVEAIRPPPTVRPGGFVIVGIVRETHPAALVLPRKAVIRELKESHVFVVDGEVAQRRDVELGLEEKEVLEIVSGLEPGERVVVAGQGGLKDGSKIKVLGAAGSDARAEAGEPAAAESQG